MDPKRLRLIVIAAAIPIAFVALLSLLGGGGGGPGTAPKNGVVVTTNAATPRATSREITLEDLMKGGGSAPPGSAAPTPLLAPADPKQVAELMEKGERAYMSGDLATARGYYYRAVTLDPACERCRTKLDSLEKKVLSEIQEAFRAGEGYLQSGRYKEAIWALERVFVLDPDPKSQFHENAKTLIEDAKVKQAASSR